MKRFNVTEKNSGHQFHAQTWCFVLSFRHSDSENHTISGWLASKPENELATLLKMTKSLEKQKKDLKFFG